ncbi:MAG TPA: SusC/RagA family TonB-linked outer membrane protein [Phnomibacter sp.]|nr:SusC/RagA family TonB-linked outer membrane protein [Phnomibacter sp.]
MKKSTICLPRKFGMLAAIVVPLLFFSSILLAQGTKLVKGVVIDSANGRPLAAVSIQAGDSKKGTSTNDAGIFSLEVEPGMEMIVSMVGYKTLRLKPDYGGNMIITLAPTLAIADEVVVIGYGTARKKDLTGAITSIKPDKLAQENPNNVQDILRGTPGVMVGYDPSAKGGGSIQIRGQRSVYTAGGHNDPLIVMDGMIFYGELSEINPDDIGQIDVLKDASAAAIYGARAANGVIIISTKKGKTGKPSINVTANVGATTKSAYREVFGPTDYINYRENWYEKDTYGVNATTGKYEAYQTGTLATKPGYYQNPEDLAKYGITIDQWRAYTTNSSGESDKSIYAKRLGMEGGVLNDYLAGNTYDWYDHTFRTGLNQDYNASVSGASDKMNYYFSMGYLSNEGAVDYNNYRAVRSNIKLDGKVNRWFDLGVNINFQDRSDGDLQPGLGQNYWDANQIRNSPFSHYTMPDGSLAQYPMGDGVIKRGVNHDFDKNYLDLQRGFTVLNTMVSAKIKLPFNINYSFNASPRMQWYYNRYFMSAALPDALPVNRGVDRNWSKRFDWSLNNTFSWEHTFATRHRVSLTAVQEAENRWYWSDGIAARNILPSDALGFHNTQNATLANSGFSTEDSHQSADGLMGRAFYAYDNKYMLTATIRRDGYSAFGQNNPYAYFPSLAVAWSFLDEKFMADQHILSTGKLRVSWGKNGNRSLGDPYVSLANLGSGLGATMGYIVGSGMDEVKYLIVDRMANPNLQWEKSVATNIGLDFGFLKNRITGSFDIYSIKTNDMIMPQRLPGFTGFSVITSNLGEVQNQGFDLAINSVNMQKKDFKWTTTFNFSYVKNRINKLYGQYEDVKDASGNVIGRKESDDITNGWFIGHPISAIWDFKINGIWQENEVNEAKRYGQKPGDPKVENYYTADDKKNADGSITPVYNNNDKQFLGQWAPPINWQLRNDFTILNNITFSFSMYSYMGHKSLSGEYLNKDNGGSLITYNFNTFSKNYWTPENPSNEYARLDATIPAGAGASQLYNRNFLRVDNISIGYSLPKKWISRFDMTNAKFFGSIRNVAAWNQDWEYGDPETGGLATRIYSMGLNVGF